MLTKIERFLPPELKNFDGNALEDRSAFFRFEMNYWFSLFPSHDYPEIAICSALDDLNGPRGPNGRNVLIVVDSVESGLVPEMPNRSRDKIQIDGIETNQGSYCSLMTTRTPKPPVRLMECNMCAMAEDFIDGDANFV